MWGVGGLAGHAWPVRAYPRPCVQLYGNRTFVSSAGPISASVVLGNQLFLEGREGAKVSVVEAFLGAPSPGALFKPPVVGNYSDPLLWAHTDRGDITILGFSSSPLSPTAAGRLSVDVASQLGSLKVEINGGGFSGSYSVTSLRGKSVVEIDGNNGPLSGERRWASACPPTAIPRSPAPFLRHARHEC